jgi:hypothetical protein
MRSPIISANGRFGTFRLEMEKPARLADTKIDGNVARLAEAFKKIPHLPHHDPIDGYPKFEIIVKALSYTAEEVERLSLALGSLDYGGNFPEKAGLFLSALINLGKENEYTVHAQHIKISCLGHYNSKNIVVKGDAGDAIGGHMSEGLIHISGNAGEGVGNCMAGGRIIVEGSVRGLTGCEMQGGEIHVNGIEPTPGRVWGGRIYHRGKLIQGK